MNAGIVKAELCRAPALMRYACHLCGGVTSKNPVHCVVQSGDYAGFRVCETCLKRHAGPGAVDAALTERAREVLLAASREAKGLLALVGRLQISSFSEWSAACVRHDRALKAEEGDQ
jgi:hypothetical protein